MVVSAMFSDLTAQQQVFLTFLSVSKLSWLF